MACYTEVVMPTNQSKVGLPVSLIPLRYELLVGSRIFECMSKERCSMKLICPSNYGRFSVLFKKPGNINIATRLSLSW